MRAKVVMVVLSIAGLASADVASHWRFDETVGPTAFDSVGTNHGTLLGASAFVAGGVSGRALSLKTATNDVVTMGNIFPMTGGVSQSIQVWVKTSSATSVFPVSRHTSGITTGYIIGIGTHGGGYGEPGKPHFYVSHSPGGEARGTTIVNDGQWHQIVCTYTANIPSIFVDGAPLEDTGTPKAAGLANAPFLVGGITFSGVPKGLFDGLIDDVQVYDCALAANAVQWLFQNPGQVYTCYPDCEEDCDLDVFDFLCFQSRFAAQNPYADCEQDGDFDVFDFLCFQGATAGGCP